MTWKFIETPLSKRCRPGQALRLSTGALAGTGWDFLHEPTPGAGYLLEELTPTPSIG